MMAIGGDMAPSASSTAKAKVYQPTMTSKHCRSYACLKIGQASRCSCPKRSTSILATAGTSKCCISGHASTLSCSQTSPAAREAFSSHDAGSRRGTPLRRKSRLHKRGETRNDHEHRENSYRRFEIVGPGTEGRQGCAGLSGHARRHEVP